MHPGQGGRVCKVKVKGQVQHTATQAQRLPLSTLQKDMSLCFKINFEQYWPSGHLSQILSGQTVSFTGHVQEQLNLNDKGLY